ncbi:MAG: hypothetical protein K8F52_11725 [Candidatus Scalindua rubra]|uniref:Uncharacterized protein n=1 Tax=Candidatus Scalindua brodae TaxID=237368 RepID=A0A0B0EQ31_9BACT|nr:MAG: hypothetical protein SCABRO_00271 [Candidatus Scalindua brodae]MBZ0109325.1 hypothetical protein [Candidatus Scalindua rubra]TWU36753.1 hypothetical protein S225a_02430 [Candidatus Brocadiaceae bacterium S225]
MRLSSDSVFRKLNNLYARLNGTISVFMNPDSGLLSENPILRKFISYQFTSQIRAKFLLIPAVIISGTLGACLTTLNGEEVKTDDNSMEKVTAYRNPFSLPSGVRFEEKAETVGSYSEYAEWKEGVVASSVNGIFQGGNIVRANINGVWVKEGDWVGEEQVMEIETENVVLLGKENEKRNLSLRGAEDELGVIKYVY